MTGGGLSLYCLPCEVEWSTLIGRDPSRHWALIGWNLYDVTPALLCHQDTTHPSLLLFPPCPPIMWCLYVTLWPLQWVLHSAVRLELALPLPAVPQVPPPSISAAAVTSAPGLRAKPVADPGTLRAPVERDSGVSDSVVGWDNIIIMITTLFITRGRGILPLQRGRGLRWGTEGWAAGERSPGPAQTGQAGPGPGQSQAGTFLSSVSSLVTLKSSFRGYYYDLCILGTFLFRKFKTRKKNSVTILAVTCAIRTTNLMTRDLTLPHMREVLYW